MPCSICGEKGHNKRSCKKHILSVKSDVQQSILPAASGAGECRDKKTVESQKSIAEYPKKLNQLLMQLISGKSIKNIITGLNESEIGHVGEAILRLLAMFSIDPNDPTQTVSVLRTNPSTKRLTYMSSTDIEQTICSGLTNSGGSDKIDIAWEQHGKIYACSSKFGKNTIKSVSDLQISDMLTDFTHSGGYTLGGKRIEPSNVVGSVLVYDGEQTKRVKEKAGVSNRVSVENMKIILDIHHLERAVSVMREKCKGCDTSDIHCVIRSLLSTEKPPLKLRFHQ